MKCDKCGKQAGDDATFCEACGAGLSSRDPAKSTSGGRVLFGCSALLLVIVVVVVLAISFSRGRDGNRFESKGPVDGSDGVITTTAPCAYELVDAAEIYSAVRRDDTSAVYGLILRGKAATVDSGTRVVNVVTVDGYTRVRITSGRHTGERCFVPSAFVK